MSIEDEERHEWFKLMCQNSPDFMVIIDRQRRFRWVNRLHPDISLDAVIGQPLETFEHPDTHERSREATERAFETGRLQVFESHARLPDGTESWYQVRCIPIVDHPDRLMLVTTDITERKAAEQQRDEYQRQLYQSQKLDALGRLAGGIAHDFNNLLTPILGYAQGVMEMLGPDHPAQSWLQGSYEAGMRAAELTNRLLAIGKETPRRAQSVDLAELVRGMEQLLRRVMPENVRLDTRGLDAGAKVWADPAQLEQVLLNLAMNACDAMPSGGDLRIQTKTEGDSAVLSVVDQGSGMTKETLRQVFEPFFTTKGERGTGLGLATAHGIVQQSGGRFEVASELGKGSTFRVILPLLRAAENVLPTGTEAQPEIAAGPPATILVVEDSDLVRAMVLRQLQSTEFEAFEARSGAEALAFASAAPPDSITLVLTDVVMPGMSGPEVVRRVRERHPRTIAVFMSGHTGNLLQDADLIGARLLQKPFTMRQLLAELRTAVKSGSPRGT